MTNRDLSTDGALGRLGADARLHIRLAGLDPIAHNPVLLSMALHKDWAGLDGFLSALESGAVPDAASRLSTWATVQISPALKRLLPDRRGMDLDLVRLSPAEFLTMPLWAPDGGDIDRPWREAVTTNPVERAYLERMLSVFAKVQVAAWDPVDVDPPARPFDMAVAAVVAHCRAPDLVHQALSARGHLGGVVRARSGPLSSDPQETCTLSALAMHHHNPVAMHAILDRADLKDPLPRIQGQAPSSPLQQMIGALWFREGGRDIVANADTLARVMVDDFKADRTDHAHGIARAIERLIGATSHGFAAVLHANVLTALLRQAREEGDAIDPLVDLARSWAPEPLSHWYARVLEDPMVEASSPMERVVENLPWQVIGAAAQSGRAEVLEEFASELSKAAAAARLAFEQGTEGDPFGRALLHNACECMTIDSSAVPIERFLATVDVLIRAGYDIVQSTGPEASRVLANNRSTTLHALSLQGGAIVLPAMIHLLELGCDPDAKDKQRWTPASALKSKGLQAPWLAAVRSHKARQAAQSAIEEIAGDLGPIETACSRP